MRDINAYESKYLSESFEEIKVKYRRKKVLSIIKRYTPDHILEIGVGREPLFQWYDAKFTIVEPSDFFFTNARNLSKGGYERITCIKGFFESDEVQSALADTYDFIVCSSLLHEVEEPKKLLSAIKKKCDKNTIVHINVPNAKSMHRLLGMTMKILKDCHDSSDANIAFQQNTVFDISMLKRMVDDEGFSVLEEGSYFIKPFSHAQMHELLNTEIIDNKVLDGLDELSELMPEYGSEIYVNCRLK